MSNVKKIVICILAILLVVLAITTNNVFATENLFDAFLNNGNNQIENIQSKNTNTNTNKNANMANASEHADAGADYSVVFVIAVCGIFATYAYKKIRDYNV